MKNYAHGMKIQTTTHVELTTRLPEINIKNSHVNIFPYLTLCHSKNYNL